MRMKLLKPQLELESTTMKGDRRHRRHRRAGVSSRWLALTWASAAACQTTAGPPPQARVVSAQEVGVLEQSPHILGRDGGWSTPLWGRSVWIYGDTVLDQADEDGRTWLHNSFSFTSDLAAADGIHPFAERLDSVGMPRMLIEPTAEEEAFNAAHLIGNCSQEPCGARYAVWPVDPIWDEQHGRALMFFSLIYAEPGAWSFQGLGSGIAEWRGFDQAPVRMTASPVRSSEHPELIWLGEEEPVPNLGLHIVGDDLYGYACPLESLVRPCRLARAPLDSLEQHDAWTWYDGAGWTSDFAAAQTLFDGNVTMTVSYNRHLERWVAVYPVLFEDTVVMRTALAPTGPWSEPLELFVGDDGDDSRWIYDAVAHAEYEEEDGRVLYVTFSRPVPDVFFGAELALVRVALE